MVRWAAALLVAFALSPALAGPAPVRPAAAADCTRTLAAGADLQAAITAAAPGETICLESGVFVGSFVINGKNSLSIRGAGRTATVLAPGDHDNLLVFNSGGIRLESLTLFLGNPSNAYMSHSNVTFADVQAAGGRIGLHYDAGSSGLVSNSSVHSHASDGILVRGDSSLEVDDSWIAVNGGVGVSSAGLNRDLKVERNIIAYNSGPGFFTGAPPCALLPPGVLEAPGCYLADIQSFLSRGAAIVEGNIILGNGSTGLVFFPGTSGTVSSNQIWSNYLTGLFAWGAHVDTLANVFDRNEEHAIEYRAFPDPERFPPGQGLWPLRASGLIIANTITRSVQLDGWLGGGVLSQGADLQVKSNDIADNAGIGVSFVNMAVGQIHQNTIRDNGAAAVCLWNDGFVSVLSNVISGNLSDEIGSCAQ